GGKPRARQSEEPHGRGSGSGGVGGRTGSVYSLFLAPTGVPGREVKPDVFPEVRWISLADATREVGDLEDRAAKYIRASNTLLINADFRVFTDMLKRWVEHYRSEEHTSELQSRRDLVCRLLLEKKKKRKITLPA